MAVGGSRSDSEPSLKGRVLLSTTRYYARIVLGEIPSCEACASFVGAIVGVRYGGGVEYVVAGLEIGAVRGRPRGPNGDPSAEKTIRSRWHLRRPCQRPRLMHDVDSSMVPNATDRMFVRLANGLCPRDESANGLNSLASLFRGTVCKPSGGFGPSRITSEGSASSNESDWKDDLKFIIPVGVFIFLLGGRYAPAEASLNESDGATATINIATVISSGSSLREQESSSSSSDQNEELSDFVLLGNTSAAGEWLDATADSRALYETASCRYAPWWWWDDNSWADSDAVLAAVEIENRLQGNCGENDTIALAFTSAITNTVDAYLEGEVAVNDAVAPKDVDNASLSEALTSSSKYDRIFVWLAGDVCARDTSTATTPQSSLGNPARQSFPHHSALV
ncbi:hypothetical protein ON010_g9618 [Phytophthora cinnamomi]|nr:hypothetical protein ON010_g9618 [Phytophthora cinnamomi]